MKKEKGEQDEKVQFRRGRKIPIGGLDSVKNDKMTWKEEGRKKGLMKKEKKKRRRDRKVSENIVIEEKLSCENRIFGLF